MPQNTRIMAYGSKTLSRKLAAIAEVASHARKLAPAIADAIAEDLSPQLEPGEQLPDVELWVKLMGRAFERIYGNMAELHLRHHHSRAIEMKDSAALRAAAVELRSHLVDVRHLLDGFCGERQGIANYEGRHDLHRIPMRSLERISTGLLALFDDPRFGWEGYGGPIPLAPVRDKLAEKIAIFKDARRAAGESRSARVHTSATSSRQMPRAERKAMRILCLFEGALYGAGFDSIAAGLRPKRKVATRVEASTTAG